MLDKFFDYLLYVVIVFLVLSMISVLVIVSIVCPPFIGCVFLALIGGAVLYYVEEVKDGRA